MRLRELCETLGCEYNANHPKRCLSEIQKEYLLEINGKDYTVVRPLTNEEKIGIKRKTDTKTLLKYNLLMVLSQCTDNNIRGDYKFFLEKVNAINNGYRLFTYDKLTDKKMNFVSQFSDILEEQLADVSNLCQFVKCVDPTLRQLFRQALSELEKEQLIKVDRIPMLVYNIKVNTNEDNLEIWHRSQMTKDQYETVMEIRHCEMEERGCKEWEDVPYSTRWEIDKKIARDCFGAVGIGYDYDLLLNRSGIQYETKKILETKMYDEIALKIISSQDKNIKELSNYELLNGIDKLIK